MAITRSSAKKIAAFLSFLVAASIFAAHFANELPLKLPKGWKSETQEGIRIIKPGDLKEGKVFTVMVPPLSKKVGSLSGLMDEGKKAMAEVGKFTALAKPAKGTTAAGWEFELVVGSVEAEGVRILGQIVALHKGGSGEGVILAVAESAETLEQYAEEFGEMIHSVGTDLKSAPAEPGRSADLKFSLPSGWEKKEVQGVVLLEKWENKEDETFGTRRLYRLFIGPGEPLKGTLKSAFVAYWNREVRPNYSTSIVPFPMMRRLKSGLACAFDGDAEASTREGVKLFCNAYLLAQGDHYVPILGMFIGGSVSDAVEKDLVSIFESARIPGASEKKVSLFDSASLVGKWDTSSSAIATYVTSSGGYAGDATVATGQAFTFNTDGTFESWLGGVGRGVIVRESDKGTWKVSDSSLVLQGGSQKTYRLYGVGSDPKVGSFIVMSAFSGTDEVVDFSYPRRPLWGLWLKKKS